jgi:Fe-Mn family superoxide dismutase
MAHNNHFFFEGLATAPDQPIGTALRRAIIKDFGSVENLKAEMLTMAEAMFGPGFVWLVRVDNGGLNKANREFRLLPTYLAGSPYAGAHNRRQPVDMTTQSVTNAKAAGGTEGLSRQISEQHTTVQNNVGSFGQYAAGNKSLAYGGVDVNPCLCVSTWEHTYLYDWKFNKRHFLDRWWTFINWREVAVKSGLQDEAGELNARNQYQTPRGARPQRS